MEATVGEGDPTATTAHMWLSAAEKKVADPPPLLLGPRRRSATADTGSERSSSSPET